MKKTSLLTLSLVVMLCFSFVLTSCGNRKDESSVEGELSRTVITEVSDSKTVVRVSFGTDYAYKYASVTVTDINGGIVYLTQLQFDNNGYGEALIFVNSAGKYTVTTVSGEANEIAQFELEE